MEWACRKPGLSKALCDFQLMYCGVFYGQIPTLVYTENCTDTAQFPTSVQLTSHTHVTTRWVSILIPDMYCTKVGTNCKYQCLVIGTARKVT